MGIFFHRNLLCLVEAFVAISCLWPTSSSFPRMVNIHLFSFRYGLEGTSYEPSMSQIIDAAKLANAHDFIMSMVCFILLQCHNQITISPMITARPMAMKLMLGKRV